MFVAFVLRFCLCTCLPLVCPMQIRYAVFLTLITTGGCHAWAAHPCVLCMLLFCQQRPHSITASPSANTITDLTYTITYLSVPHRSCLILCQYRLVTHGAVKYYYARVVDIALGLIVVMVRLSGACIEGMPPSPTNALPVDDGHHCLTEEQRR